MSSKRRTVITVETHEILAVRRFRQLASLSEGQQIADQCAGRPFMAATGNLRRNLKDSTDLDYTACDF